MQNKKIGLLLTVLALAIFSVMFVSAVVTIDSPTPVYYSGTMNVSVMNDLVNSTTVSYNVTLYCNKSGGSVNARLAGDKVVTIWNNTAKDDRFEQVISITGLTESLTYNCSAYADNGTVAGNAPAWSVAVGSIIIDSTKPSCDLKRVYGTSIPYMGLQELIWSSSDTLNLYTTVVTYTTPSGTATYTDADRDLILQGSDLTAEGDYSATLVATDRAANTCTSPTVSWNIYVPGAAAGAGAGAAGAGAGSFSIFGPGGIDLSKLNWGTIALVILAIIVIVAIAKKK